MIPRELRAQAELHLVTRYYEQAAQYPRMLDIELWRYVRVNLADAARNIRWAQEREESV